MNDALLQNDDGGIAAEHARRLKFPPPGQWNDSTNVFKVPDPLALKPGQQMPTPSTSGYLTSEVREEAIAPRALFEQGNGQLTLELTALPSPAQVRAEIQGYSFSGQQMSGQNMLQNQQPDGEGAEAHGGSLSGSGHYQQGPENSLQTSEKDKEGAEDQLTPFSQHQIPDQNALQRQGPQGESPLQIDYSQTAPEQRNVYGLLERQPSTPRHVATIIENLKKVTPEMVRPAAASAPQTPGNGMQISAQGRQPIERLGSQGGTDQNMLLPVAGPSLPGAVTTSHRKRTQLESGGLGSRGSKNQNLLATPISNPSPPGTVVAADLAKVKKEPEEDLERAISYLSDERYQRRIAAFYELSRNRVAYENPQWEDPVTEPDYPPNSFDALMNPPRSPRPECHQPDQTYSAWTNHRQHIDETWQPLGSKADAAVAQGPTSGAPHGDGRGVGAVRIAQEGLSLERDLQPMLARIAKNAQLASLFTADPGSERSSGQRSESTASQAGNGEGTSSAALDSQTLEIVQQRRAEAGPSAREGYSTSSPEPKTVPPISAPTTDPEPNPGQASVLRASGLDNSEEATSTAPGGRNSQVNEIGDRPKPSIDEQVGASHNMIVMMLTLPEGPSVEELFAASPFPSILKIIPEVGEGTLVGEEFAADSLQRQMLDLRATKFHVNQLSFAAVAAPQPSIQSSPARAQGQEGLDEEEVLYSASPIGVLAFRPRRSVALLNTALPPTVPTIRPQDQRSLGQASSSTTLDLDGDNCPSTLLPAEKLEAWRNYLSAQKKLRDALLLKRDLAAQFDILEEKIKVKEDEVIQRNEGLRRKMDRYDRRTREGRTGSFTRETGRDVDLKEPPSWVDAVFWEGERLAAEVRRAGEADKVKEDGNVKAIPGRDYRESESESESEGESGGEEFAETKAPCRSKQPQPWADRSPAKVSCEMVASEMEVEVEREEVAKVGEYTKGIGLRESGDDSQIEVLCDVIMESELC